MPRRSPHGSAGSNRLQGRTLRDLVREARAHGSSATISSQWGCEGEIDAVLEFPKMRSLSIAWDRELDLAPLRELRHLEDLSLYLYGRARYCDLRPFEHLVRLAVTGASHLILPQHTRRLQRLWMTGYAPRSRDLGGLGRHEGMREFTLVRPRIESLEGLSRCSGLRELEICYCRPQLDIRAVSRSKRLERIRLKNCPHLEGLNGLADCRRLKFLVIAKCGSVRSVRFARALKSLRYAKLLRTKSLDGSVLDVGGVGAALD